APIVAGGPSGPKFFAAAAGTPLDITLLGGGLEVLHDLVHLPQADHQRRPGGQYVATVELVNLAPLPRRHPLPTGAARDGVAVHRVATPRGQDELGIPADDFVGRHDALARARTVPQLGKDIAAPGDLDELRDPADAGNERIVPLLEVHARTMRPHARVLTDLLHLVPDVLDEAARRPLAAERAADHEHGAQHVFERALVRAQHRDSA